MQCLCIECHSKVDAVHEERWAKGANAVMLKDYINRYRNSVTNNDLFNMPPTGCEDIVEEYNEYEEDYESYIYTEEDTWDAMTDGMYGDYPGGDIDYEFLGY